MNKLNKELLDRALVEGVDESHDGNVLSLGVGNRLWNGFHITAPMGQFNNWQYVCTKEEYLAAKAEKESRKTVTDVINRFRGGEVFALRNICYDTSTGDYSAVSNTSDLESYEYFACTNEQLSSAIEDCETNFGTSLPYDEYKKGYKLMQDTVSEYDIGCYYEFSDDEDFGESKVLQLSQLPDDHIFPYQACINGSLEVFKYIRPLTTKAGEIRKPKPLSGFINLYSVYNIESTIFKTRDLANLDQYVSARVACIDLSQFNEGEGL